MRAVLAITALVAAVTATTIPSVPGLGLSEADAVDWAAFNNFATKFERAYEVEEKLTRFRVFQANMRTAERLTREHNGEATFGVTRFSDLTPEEFASTYLTLNSTVMMQSIASGKRDGRIVPFAESDEGKALARAKKLGASSTPATYNWASSSVNKVTPVRDQGQCGCCYAFSACGEYEAQILIKGYATISNPIVLAPQQIVDCDQTDSGCGGGMYMNAWSYIYSNGGIMQEATYKYKGVQGTCAWSAGNAYNVKPGNGGSTTPGTTPANIYAYIASHGPASAALDATLLQTYTSGVLKASASACPNLNHAVLITGYDANNAYYIVKNSWSTSWGINGYFYISTSSCLISSLVYGSTGF